jgi:16S rRNA (guanine(966)-N(2))-methyltransferase RsmD
MKILTGCLKGLVLKSPKGRLRPTQNKVRKAIFDVLADSIRGAHFLELFAGSGAVGIEALSCGADFVWFVENDRNSLRLLNQNLANIKIDNYQVIPADAFRAIEQFARQKKQFDFIFLDPPYYSQCNQLQNNLYRISDRNSSSHRDISKKTLQMLSSCDILKISGLVIIQHYKKDIIPKNIYNFNLFKKKIYGDTVVSFYQCIRHSMDSRETSSRR